MAAELSDVVPSTAKTSETAAASIDLTEPFLLGDWRIEPALRRACRGDTVVKIDPRNLRVLQILAERQGKLVSTREIEALAWEGVVVTPDSLYQSIRQLRQALGESKSPAKYIETVPRRGYRLVADVLACSSSAAVIADRNEQVEPEKLEGYALKRTWRSSFAAARSSIAAAAIIAISSLIAMLGLMWVNEAERSEALKPTQALRPAAAHVPTLEQAKLDPALMNAQSLRDLGRVARRRGRMREALTLYEQALQRQIAAAGESNELAGELYAEIANLLFALDDETAARSQALKAVAILNELAPASPSRAQTLAILAAVLIGSGEYDEAERLLADAFSIASKSYGSGHISTAHLLDTQASLRFAQGNLPEAEKVAREALAVHLRAQGPNDATSASARTLIGSVMIARGQVSEAEREARLAVEILRRVEGDESPYLSSAKHVLAEALIKQRLLVEAEALLREQLDVLTRARAVDWRVARAASALAETLLHKGHLTEAEEYLALAQGKLIRKKGWPIERESRLLGERLQLLAAIRTNTVELTKL